MFVIKVNVMKRPVFVTSKISLLSNGVVCIKLQPILSLVGRILNFGELLTSIFMPSYDRLRSNLCSTR